MGQKVNPLVIRLGVLNTWSSRWFDERRYKDILLEDFTLRKTLMSRLANSGIARVEIERSINSIKVIAYVSKPGLVIGRAGTGLEELKKFITRHLGESRKGKLAPKIDIRIEPVKEPNLDAYLVAKMVSDQLLRRLPFKRVLNQSAERVMGSGAKGVRILLAGRVQGAEIARREKIQKGTVPLSTMRENVQFASYPCLTKKGYVGIKVWINRGNK